MTRVRNPTSASIPREPPPTARAPPALRSTAQSLIGNPDLLILDELTAGLDPEQRLRFRDTISHLAEDRTVLLSSHQTDDIAALCKTVLVMDQGRILFSGTPRQLTDIAAGHVWISDRREPTIAVA